MDEKTMSITIGGESKSIRFDSSANAEALTHHHHMKTKHATMNSQMASNHGKPLRLGNQKNKVAH
jgi:hypothetical protein